MGILVVHLQRLCRNVVLQADLALEFDLGVHLKVTLQVDLLREASRAIFAAVRAFARVRPHVDLQLVHRRTPQVAGGALILLGVVALHVLQQVLLLGK